MPFTAGIHGGSQSLPVAHQRIHAVITSTKASQLHLLSVLDLLGVAIAPFNGHIGISVGVYKHIKGAVAVELWQKGHGSGDLSEYRLDLCLDYFLRLLGGCLVVSNTLSEQQRFMEVDRTRLTRVRYSHCRWSSGQCFSCSTCCIFGPEKGG